MNAQWFGPKRHICLSFSAKSGAPSGAELEVLNFQVLRMFSYSDTKLLVLLKSLVLELLKLELLVSNRVAQYSA